MAMFVSVDANGLAGAAALLFKSANAAAAKYILLELS